ncbi:MAG TPA: hypothetical protein VIG51_06620 [Candidatus Baltobacteraceae bacterium]|jgi:hypothetical protein
MTQVYAKRDALCPFSATLEMIERLHTSGAKQLVGPLPSIRTHVQWELAEVPDRTDETRIHEALLLKWKAPTRMPLPVMSGLITVRPNGPATELRMEGTYVPPLGLFGEAFDRVIGRHLAQHTANRFLDELRDFVEQEWQKERSRDPAR